MNEFDAESMIELKRAFRIFDSNNDGLISFEELKQAFDNLHKKLTNEELRIVVIFIVNKFIIPLIY